MKKTVYLHNINITLGEGLRHIKKQQEKRWIYLVPSASLIPNIKELIVRDYSELLGNIEILTFDQLMRKLMVFENRQILNQEEQELLVKRAIEKTSKEKGLLYFNDSIGKTGLINQVEMWLGEIKRSGVAPKTLQEFWKDRPEKFQELSWIYEEYQKLLKEYALIDHEEPYFSFIEKEIHSEVLTNYCGIVADQFNDFSPLQMEILNKLAEYDLKIKIHLAIDENRRDLFQWAFHTLDFLLNLGFNKKYIENQYYDKESSVIKHIKKSLFSSFPEKMDGEDNIALYNLSGIKQEVESVASEIKSLVLDGNIGLDDIAIIIPQIERYEIDIKRVMDKSEIPIRLRRKETLIQNPFVQSIISFLKAGYFQKKDWVTMIYSPYFKWAADIVPSTLVMILRELSFPKNKNAWEERFKAYLDKHEEKREELLDYDKVMKQIYELISIAPSKGKYYDFIQYINKVENELRIKERIKNYFINNPTKEAAYRDIKAYESWEMLKDDLLTIDKYLVDKETINGWHWLNSLVLAAEKSKYDYTQGKRSGVHILEPNQIRGRKFKVVFIVGLIDGLFPRTIKNDWLLPDNERYNLRKIGVHLHSSWDYENQQKYHFFQSVVCAENKIYLVYSSKTEEGKERLSSFFVEETLNLFHDNTIKNKKLEVSDIIPSTWKECINGSLLVNRIYFTLQKTEITPTEEDEAIEGLSIYNNSHPQTVESINQRLYGEIDRWNLSSLYEGTLKNKQIINEIKNGIGNRVWSTTQLNAAIKCRFSYFSQHILKLTKWEEPEETLSSLEKGDLLHRVLQRFFGTFKSTGAKIDPSKEDEYLKTILAIAEEEWNLFLNQEYRYIHPVISDLDWQRIKQDVKQMLSHEMYWRRKSTIYFHPAYLELSFGLPIIEEEIEKEVVDSQSIVEKAKIRLPNRPLYLRGKIDRVDMNDEGQFVIYDYKTGKAPENKEIINGLNLQLPLYLFVLEELLGIQLEKNIGAAFYTKGKKNGKGEITDSRNRGIWKEPFLDLVGISNRISGKIDETSWNEWISNIKQKIDSLLDYLEQGNYDVLPEEECPTYCPFQKICRRNDDRIKLKRQNGGEGNGIQINR